MIKTIVFLLRDYLFCSTGQRSPREIKNLNEQTVQFLFRSHCRHPLA
jgi:hypothetical protein